MTAVDWTQVIKDDEAEYAAIGSPGTQGHAFQHDETARGGPRCRFCNLHWTNWALAKYTGRRSPNQCRGYSKRFSQYQRTPMQQAADHCEEETGVP